MRRPLARLAGPFLALGALVALAASGAAAAGDVHRCTSASGKVEFSDTPCGASRKAAVVDARPNSLDTSAVREQLLRIENKALRDEVAAGRPATPMQAPLEPTRADSPACRTATRDAEAAATSIENNRELIRARRSAMFIACGVPEPDRNVTQVRVDGRDARAGRPVDPRITTR